MDNGFWKDGSGFAPLLTSMGAVAFSFTPTRAAIVAEGAADAILLPTLLRQASSEERLGFQVAPGLSSVAPTSIADLLTEAGRIGFVVDGDPGGIAIANKLRHANVPEEKIVILRVDEERGLEVEDFIDVDIYVEAVNAELELWNTVIEQLKQSHVPDALRTKAVERWCEAQGYYVPDKRAVAQRVVDRIADGPVFMVSRQELLVQILANLRAAL